MSCEDCVKSNNKKGCKYCIKFIEDDFEEENTNSDYKNELDRLLKVLEDLNKERDNELKKVNYIYDYKINKVKMLCSDLVIGNWKTV